jgi:hypothetical protein
MSLASGISPRPPAQDGPDSRHGGSHWHPDDDIVSSRCRKKNGPPRNGISRSHRFMRYAP